MQTKQYSEANTHKHNNYTRSELSGKSPHLPPLLTRDVDRPLYCRTVNSALHLRLII